MGKDLPAEGADPLGGGHNQVNRLAASRTRQ
jgi:hypothetical protein